MKQRIKFALADIRYVQTQIEKILNKSNLKNQRTQQNKQRSNDKTQNLSKSKLSNFNTTPQKRQDRKEIKERSTSPKNKNKEVAANRIKTMNMTPQKNVNPSSKNIQTEKKVVVQQTKQLKLENQIQIFQKVAQNKTQELPQKNSARLMWLQRQKITTASLEKKDERVEQKDGQKQRNIWKQKKTIFNNTSPPPLTKIKQVPQAQKAKINETAKQALKAQPNDQFQPVFQPQPQPQVPLYLQKKNNLPLRSQQLYLIKKYNNNQAGDKQEELRDKYRLLDERLLRLRNQIKNRDPLITEAGYHNQSKIDHALKKQVLSKYNRYSPLGKFIRINEKFKKDHERSISSHDRRSYKLKSDNEEGRRKWI